MSNSTKKLIANTVGSIGYIFLLIEWLWATIIIGYPLFSSDFSFFIPPAPTAKTAPTLSFGPLQPLITIIAIATSILVLALAAVTIAQLPKTIAKQGKKTTRRVAKKVIPHVIPKTEQTKKRVVVLSTRLAFALKCLAIIIPIIALIVAPNTTSLSTELTLIVCCFFALITALSFAVQSLIAYALKLPQKYLW